MFLRTSDATIFAEEFLSEKMTSVFSNLMVVNKVVDPTPGSHRCQLFLADVNLNVKDKDWSVSNF